VQKRTGQTLAEYLKPRLFDPLGIAKPVWNTNAQGIALGATGSACGPRTSPASASSTSRRASGRKAASPKEWIELATSRQVSNGSNPKATGSRATGSSSGAAERRVPRDGAFGQYLRRPSRSGHGPRDHERPPRHAGRADLIWDKLLPGIYAGTVQAGPEVDALRSG
jgi:hypothetical protein